MRSELWDMRIMEIVAAGKGFRTCKEWAAYFGCGYHDCYNAASKRNACSYFDGSNRPAQVITISNRTNGRKCIHIGEPTLRAAGFTKHDTLNVAIEPGRIILTPG